MAYLNINIPQIECFVRGEYLKNLEGGHGEHYPCVVFGFASIPNRAPLFHFMMEDGGVWWRMPIQAFCSRPDAEPSDGYEQVLWDSFSYYPSVTTFTAMLNKRIEFVGRSGRHHAGQYLFTLDWAHEDRNIIDPGCAEMPGQHKCGHVIAMDNGNYALQPNNRIRLYDPSFTTKWGTPVTERKLNTHLWTVENQSKWLLEDSENYDYGVTNTEPEPIVARRP